MQLVNYTPNRSELTLQSTVYQTSLSDFKSSAVKFKALEEAGAVDFEFSPDDSQVIDGIKSFMAWTRTFTNEEWAAGMKIPVEELHRVCGKNKGPLNDARRSCVVKLKRGNRRAGEGDTYGISKQHLLGLAKCLTGYVAHLAAQSCIEIEAAESRISMESELDAKLHPGTYHSNLDSE